MLFNSYIFILLFLPLTLAGYYILNRYKKYDYALIFLTFMSFIFYGYNNIYYLIILIGSILVNYLLSLKIHANKSKSLTVIGVLLNLGILFFFKYYDFFIDNMNHLLKKDIPFLSVALPLGISFYTFQQLSFIVDTYKGDSDKYTLLEYASYVSFFPQLVAGPIVFHTELIPQFRRLENRSFNSENFSRGLYAFSCGLAKKVLIADTLGRVVNVGYSNIDILNSTSALLVVLSYALQIYFDFSGYCDMAYGIGYMFNVILPVNFNSPFKSKNVGEFWNRWHITLNRFFTKYVYIPLGGSRRSIKRTYINIMIVFLVSGLWHGADWSFVIWGGIYGIAVCISRMITKKDNSNGRHILGITINFIVFVLTFIFFRAENTESAINMIKHLFYGGFGSVSPLLSTAFNDIVEMKFLYRLGLGTVISSIPALFLILFIIIILVSTFTLKNTQEKVNAMKFNTKELISIAFMMIFSIISLSEISAFLYFNF